VWVTLKDGGLEMLSMFWLMYVRQLPTWLKFNQPDNLVDRTLGKPIQNSKETPHQPQSLSTGQQKYDKRKLVVSCESV